MGAVIFIIAGVGVILFLAVQSANNDSGDEIETDFVPDTAGVTDDGSNSFDGSDSTDYVAQSVPSNSATAVMQASDFNPGVSVAINPLDPDTWPGGDAIWDVARAIARAEGYGKAGANPTVLNNPGDISDGAYTYGSEFHSGSNVTHFPDPETGWNALYTKLLNIHDGRSKVYSNNFTWTQLAQKWAGDWQNWVNNVTRNLGVSPSDRVGDYWDA